MPQQKSALETVQDILVDTRETVNKLLEGEHDVLRVSMKTKFDLMINHLGFINGKPADTLAAQSPLSPIKDVMGSLVEKPSKVTVEMLSPDEERKLQFQVKVDKLAQAFPNLTNEKILEAYKADQLVIRGVARKAGLEKYKQSDVAITSEFLDDIRTALSAQEVFNQNKLKVGKEFENPDQQ